MKDLFVIVATAGATLLPMLAASGGEPPPQVYQAPSAAGSPAPMPGVEPAAAPEAAPAPPPSAPPKRSAAELEKLVGPIALYPDPLIATILPASVYPLEIVQAARFVQNTNNLAQLEAQPWDENVKALARVPAVIQKMNDDLQWTVALGEAFLAQDKEVMAAIQNLRGKAQQTGTLQTTPQQVVVVTNEVVEKTIEQQVVVVTNTIVQIQPSNPEVVYVPQYNPAVVYAPPPAYVYDPLAPLVTFGVGVAVGAVIANNCDWHGGGVYVGPHGAAVWGGGGYHGDVNVNANINRNVNYNQNVNVNNARTTAAGQQKWQPDQNHLRTGGAASSTAGTREARGWSAPSAPSAASAASARPAASSVAAGSAASARPTVASPPSRSAPSANAPPPRASTGGSRPASSGSAFSGVSSGASARDYSSRGTASRSGSSMGGSRGGVGGGGRGGGRR